MNEFNLNTKPKIKSGFTPTEAYFDAFSKNILNNLPLQKPKTLKWYANKKRLAVLVAAIFVIGLMIPAIYFNQQPKDDLVVIDNYLENNSNLSQYDLINMLDDNQIEDLQVAIEDKNLTIDDLLDEASVVY